ncbi:pLS20_p028 family conjugation system transmembrane protein [Enterococcus innesii]|uniref:pLS20_p028 family conjugation system transmembrane protein n=1 Tax=Enterococcus innesii TaxID=2839759 RepID=UPI0034A2A651
MDDILKILKQYKEYLHVTDIVSWALRKIGWLLLSLFKALLDGMEKLLDSVYSLASFPVSDKVTNWVTKNQILVFGIGGVCLIIYFLRYISNRNIQLRSLVDHFLLGTIVLLSGLTIVSTLTGGAFDLAKSIYSDDGSTATAIFNENITDVTSFDGQAWDIEKAKPVDLKTDQYDFLDITEEIDPDKLEVKDRRTKEIFSHKIVLNGSNKTSLEELDSGWFKVDEHYYRYSWHPWRIFFALLTSIIVLFFASFKYLHVMFNIAYNSMIMGFFAYSDLVEGAKLRKIIQGTIHLLMNAVLFAVTLKLYRLFSNYISVEVENPFSSTLLKIILALLVLEGPWIIQELTGYQGGLKSSVAQLATLGGALYGASRLQKALKEPLGKFKENLQKGFDYTSGTVKGAMNESLEKFKEKTGIGKELQEEKAQENQAPEGLNLQEQLSDKEKENFAREVHDSLKEPTKATNQQTLKESNSAVDKEELAVPGSDSSQAIGLEDPVLSESKQTEAEVRDQAQQMDKEVKDYRKTTIPASMQELLGEKTQLDNTTEKKLPGNIPNGISLATQERVADLANGSLLAETSTAERFAQSIPKVPLQQLAGQYSGVQAYQHTKMPHVLSDPLETLQQPVTSLLAETTASSEVPVFQPTLASARTLRGVANPSLSTISVPSTISAAKQLGIAQHTGTQAYLPMTSANVLASSILKPAAPSSEVVRPAFQQISLPPSIQHAPGRQQLQSDLLHGNQPLTNQTLPELISEKWADRQMKQAEQRKPRLIRQQVGKNTGKKVIDAFDRSLSKK